MTIQMHPVLKFCLAATLAGLTHPVLAGVVTPDFSMYDRDGDGRISLEEYQAQGGLIKSFDEGDVNRDLYLSREELARASASQANPKPGYYIDDSWITARVKSMLLKDAIVKGLNVKVETRKGMVQLTGWVSDEEQANQAARIARSIDGVKSVINDLQVRR